jgi:hypothetical protein
MNNKTAILIPGTDGLYKGIKEIALTLKPKLVTDNYNRVADLLKNDILDYVVIIEGSSKSTAYGVYKYLKRINKRVKFVIVDGWDYKIRKKDKMIFLPGPSNKQIVDEIRKAINGQAEEINDSRES